jgi:MraZ protein
MLIGEYDSKVTDKNRIAMPKKFRDELGEKLIIMQGYEGCIILVDENRFLALTKDITTGKFINDAVRDTTRFLVGSAHEVTPDKQGRFVLPQSLKSFSGVTDEVIFLGLLNWVEIWDKNKWNERKQSITINASEISNRLDQESSNKL